MGSSAPNLVGVGIAVGGVVGVAVGEIVGVGVGVGVCVGVGVAVGLGVGLGVGVGVNVGVGVAVAVGTGAPAGVRPGTEKIGEVGVLVGDTTVGVGIWVRGRDCIQAATIIAVTIVATTRRTVGLVSWTMGFADWTQVIRTRQYRYWLSLSQTRRRG